MNDYITLSTYLQTIHFLYHLRISQSKKNSRKFLLFAKYTSNSFLKLNEQQNSLFIYSKKKKKINLFAWMILRLITCETFVMFLLMKSNDQYRDFQYS